MPFLELFDETIDINSTENYEVSVELSLDSLSFCVLDTIRNKFIMLRSLQPENGRKYSLEEISEMITRDDFLSKRYKKVNIIMPSSKFTLIPSPLFDPGKRDEYFSFNHVSPESDLILNNKLTDPDSYLVYAVNQPLYELVQERWPGVHPVHHLKPLLENVRRSVKEPHENYIHIHVEHDFFNLIYYSNKTLKFCNSFNCRNSSDILYYTLNMIKSMDIRQEETVYLSGQADRNDDLSSSLTQYIRSIKFAEPSGNFTLSYVFNETGLHRFFNLISVVNCV